MNKEKTLLIIITSLIVILFGITGYFIFNQKGPRTTEENSPETPYISVAGMNIYIDSDFGFSFYYPHSWTIKQAPLIDPNAYAGGVVKKILQINNTEGQVLEIAEYHSRERTITYPETNCPAGSGCPAQRLYFDSTNNTWMIEYPKGDNNNLPAGSTKIADLSKNTMGGLHIIDGFSRFNGTGIIPLGAEKFLVVLTGTEPVNLNPLVQTIVATDPTVATPLSLKGQQEIVHKESVIYGVTATPIDGGRWYKDAQYVYDSKANIVSGANPSTFTILTAFSDASDSTSTSFATDGIHIYYAGGEEVKKLEGADPATFVMIRQSYQIPYAPTSGKYGQSFTQYDTTYQKDKTHVWDWGRLIPGADPNTFMVTGPISRDNPDGSVTLAHDANHSYGHDKNYNPTIDGKTIFNN